MTPRIQTIAALLIAGAALAATPGFAAETVPGNRGPAEKPANRDAPITLPGPVVAKAIPKVEAATLSRGIFGEDLAAALMNLGTVTLSRDGSISESPVSDALRGIFETEVKGHKTK
jgi:hypothetical protein